MSIVVLCVKHNKLNAAIDGYSWYFALAHTICLLKQQSLAACCLLLLDLDLTLNWNTRFLLRQHETSEKGTRDLRFGIKLPQNDAVANSYLKWLSNV